MSGWSRIDSTILATAVPSIVNDLGGFAQFPWLFSIFLLAQAVSVPIFAKFSDQVGRKPVMLIGVGVFVLGSVLCGFAWSMPALIVFRALQGLGAGAIQPTAMTIVGDIYSVDERAKVQGYVASVWAISAVVGPTLGGLFVDFLNWRWIFFVNIPLGAIAAYALVRKFHEQVHRQRHRIDIAGAALLITGASLLILGLLEGGVLWPWFSVPSVAILGGGTLLLVVFGLVERRASEPILPGWVFRSRLLNSTNVAALAVGVILIGLTSYIPLYAQGVLGHQRAGRRLRPGGADPGLAARRLAGRPDLPADRLPQHGADRIRRGHRWRRAAGHALGKQFGLAVALTCFVLGHRHGAHRRPDPDRGPVLGRLGPARRGHRHQHVRPLDGQRPRHRRLRRHRQRHAEPATRG